MKALEQYFWVWYWFFAMCAIIALVCYAPELVGLFFGLLAFVVCSGVVVIGAAHALQETHTPEPEKNWVGAIGPVAEVGRMDLHDMEIEEDWQGTGSYARQPGQVADGRWKMPKWESVYCDGVSEENGVLFYDVSQEEQRRTIESIEKEKKARREAGHELEIKNTH